MSHLPEKSSTSMEMEKPPVPKTSKSSASLSVRKKASMNKSLIVRRSVRLQNLIQPAQNREIGPIVEHLNYVESEREDDEPHVEESTPNPIPAEKSLEDKIDRLAETIEELKSMIEALTDENCQLTKKLELTLAKLEAYKEVKDVMDKMKDVILISNLTKATEAVTNLSSQALFGRLTSPAAVIKKDAKRKRGRKNSEAT
ncbi:hypothetical protein LguiB_029056 [Lonicera macranthoides]